MTIEKGEPVTRELADKDAEDLKKLFFLLADESRLRILHYLMQEEEMNVRTLCEKLGHSQPAVSHHLGLMRTYGMLQCRRDGKHNYYSIVSNCFRERIAMLFGSLSDNGSIRFSNFSLSFEANDA